MRWERLFADLETELAAAEAAERDVEVAERTRAEVAKLRLVDRLRVAGEASLTVELAGVGSWAGRVVDTGPDWVLLRGDPRGDALVALDAVRTVSGLPPRSAVPGSEGRVAERFRIGAVLRGVARDRAGVQVWVRDGRTHAGTVDRVGADYLELAEHEPDLPRRTAAVRGVCLVPFAALAAVVVSPQVPRHR
ncbi:MAG: hypothetical protein GEV10_01265 [Streptosporangiales bacterium]|nr:hypothetical protein [Streptosporangiales bacterium]